MTDANDTSLPASFASYVAVIRRLRAECPWDREQTHASLKVHLLEEAYEAAETIEHQDWKHLSEELGDLLLHVTLHAVIAEESGSFNLMDVIGRNQEKLIRRHPHVFGNRTFTSNDEILKNWERTKLEEGRRSITDGLPRALPALIRAHRIQEKVSKVGFDWNDKRDVWTKVEEEMRELHEADQSGHAQHVEEEFGDVLFALVNYSRFLKVHPEEALRRSIDKFTSRFQRIEEEVRRRGLKIEEVGLAELDRIWEDVKSRDGAQGS